jgi:hypothetical protein
VGTTGKGWPITQEDPPLLPPSDGSKEGHVNLDDLPDEIVQPLAQLGSALLDHARAHRDHSLAEDENGVLGAWRRAAPVLLQAVV